MVHFYQNKTSHSTDISLISLQFFVNEVKFTAVQQYCMLFLCTRITQVDLQVAQLKVWYLVLARYECDEAELVDEYVGNIVQKLFKGKHRSHDLTSSQQWLRTVHLKACLLTSADRGLHHLQV